MFGKGYIIDRCIALFKQERTTFYFADVLKVLTEGVAAIGRGKLDLPRLEDMIYPKPQDNRTSSEIIEGVRAKLRGD